MFGLRRNILSTFPGFLTLPTLEGTQHGFVRFLRLLSLVSLKGTYSLELGLLSGSSLFTFNESGITGTKPGRRNYKDRKPSQVALLNW